MLELHKIPERQPAASQSPGSKISWAQMLHSNKNDKLKKRISFRPLYFLTLLFLVTCHILLSTSPEVLAQENQRQEIKVETPAIKADEQAQEAPASANKEAEKPEVVTEQAVTQPAETTKQPVLKSEDTEKTQETAQPEVPKKAEKPAAPQEVAKPDFAELVNALNTRSFSKQKKAITAIAESDHERAVAVLRALEADNAVDFWKLFYRKSDKKIFIVKQQGSDFQLLDAVTGEKAGTAPTGKFKKVPAKSSIRNFTKSLLADLTLRSKNVAVRMEAAEEIFQNPDEKFLAPLDAALKKETNDTVRKAFAKARASVILRSDASDDDKLAAITAIGEYKDPKSLYQLTAAVNNSKGVVKEAAEKAVAAIEKHLKFLNVFQNVIFGLSLGSVLLLAAIGLAITFGVMGVINMAHGEMMMIGAYSAFVVQAVLTSIAPALSPYSLVIALPVAFAIAGLVGIVIERCVIQFLYKRPLDTLLATWGVSLVIQQAVRSIFGPRNQVVTTPEWLTGNLEIAGLSLTYNRFAIILFCLAAFFILMFILRNTFYGLKTRAVTQNRQMAASMGVSTKWIDALTFGLGCGIAGIAGVALSQIDNVSPDLGQKYIVDSFMVVVFGGVGNLWGALVGAFSLGVLNKFLEPVIGAVFAKVLILVFIILFIQKRPRGLFPQKGRAAES